MAGAKRQTTARTKKKAPAKAAKGAKPARSPARKTAKPAKPAKKGSSASRARSSTAAKPAARASRTRPPAKPANRAARPAAKPSTKTARPNAPRSATGKALMTLDKLHQVAVTATNLDASVAFYRDTLGLRFIARFDPPGLAFFNLGGSGRLMLSATASAATLYFLVDDLKAAFREFTKRGVHFLQPPALIHRDEAGDFGKRGTEEWMAFFRDPGGNMLALVEKR